MLRTAVGDTSEKVLRVGTLTAIGSLDPHRAHDFTGQVVLSQVFESPYARYDGRIEPRLVVGPPVRRDPSSYELEVRSDARFSDGSPVTAADLAQSIKPALDPLGIDAIATGDRVLLQSRSWRHRPEELLSTSAATVVKRGDRGALGTGPFAIAETSPLGLRLARNPHALRRPRVDALEIRWFVPGADGRPTALVAALEAGEIDFTLALARDDVADLQRVRKLFQPGMSTAFLSLNTSAPHFARVEVRRALAMAIDRYRLAELCYSNPAAFVARCLLPPALGRGSDGLRHDPAAARTVLAGAGLPAKLQMIRVWGPRPYLARPDAVATGIVRQLRTLGIEVHTTISKDSEDYSSLISRGNYDLVLGGWFADTLDPIDYLESTLGSGAILGAGHVPAAACNYSRWRDPQIDRLLVEARTGAGPRAIDDILARVASEVPLVPLMHGPRVVVHAWRVKGYDPDASVFPDFAAIDLED